MTDGAALGPVAILAGSGDLPLLVADRLAAGGREHRILALRGFAGRALRSRADAVHGLLDVGGIVACLDRWGPCAVTLAGGVRRPSASVALDAFAALRSRGEIARLLDHGDDNLLRGVAAMLAERGHRLAGLRELAPELLAEPGTYGRRCPGPDDASSIATGIALLAALSPYDVGQAVALRGSRVVAIEGPEGTDRMLARARRPLWARALRAEPPRGVLVKAPKRGQDLRLDLPAVGPATVANAARAGLAGIAVASGLTLVIDRPRTVALADRLGLFVVGVPTGEESLP